MAEEEGSESEEDELKPRGIYACMLDQLQTFLDWWSKLPWFLFIQALKVFLFSLTCTAVFMSKMFSLNAF